MRAGTGGDEAALFAGDLFRMYRATPSQRLEDRDHFETPARNAGGYKEIIAWITARACSPG